MARKTTAELQYIVWASREINDILKSVAQTDGHPKQASAVGLLKYLRAAVDVIDFTVPVEAPPLQDVANGGAIINISSLPGIPIGTRWTRDKGRFVADGGVVWAERAYVIAHPELFEAE